MIPDEGLQTNGSKWIRNHTLQVKNNDHKGETYNVLGTKILAIGPNSFLIHFFDPLEGNVIILVYAPIYFWSTIFDPLLCHTFWNQLQTVFLIHFSSESDLVLIHLRKSFEHAELEKRYRIMTQFQYDFGILKLWLADIVQIFITSQSESSKS